MFKVDDAVLVDTIDYELASPGTSAKLPGVVLAVNEGPRLCYDVRLRLQLGTMMDLTVPAEKVTEPEASAPSAASSERGRPHSFHLSCTYNA
ncbi:MAG: hypothetical protein ACHQ4J_13855 [Candidatus Binatia bacterium]